MQLLPTSPLLTSAEIKGFVDEIVKSKNDTLVSVENQQIACVYNTASVNFKKLDSHKSSQDMGPVQSYATVLMAWRYESFKQRGQ